MKFWKKRTWLFFLIRFIKLVKHRLIFFGSFEVLVLFGLLLGGRVVDIQGIHYFLVNIFARSPLSGFFLVIVGLIGGFFGGMAFFMELFFKNIFGGFFWGNIFLWIRFLVFRIGRFKDLCAWILFGIGFFEFLGLVWFSLVLFDFDKFLEISLIW